MRRNDVASTSFRRRVPTRFLINRCQIITFLILKYDIIENSRIELRGIVLPVQVGGLLGGAKGYVGPPPPLSNYWGGGGGGWPPLFLRLCNSASAYIQKVKRWAMIRLVKTLNPKKCDFNPPAIQKEFLSKFDKYNILAL